jgi:hypothetical protein
VALANHAALWYIKPRVRINHSTPCYDNAPVKQWYLEPVLEVKKEPLYICTCKSPPIHFNDYPLAEIVVARIAGGIASYLTVLEDGTTNDALKGLNLLRAVAGCWRVQLC